MVLLTQGNFMSLPETDLLLGRSVTVPQQWLGLHGPGVSLYLLHEVTGHPQLPRVKLAQKTHASA